MENKQLNIVSHSHWDREWYLSHAKHNYRLIRLLDTLIETFERDSEFKSFHLDGQVILINDYLEVRPQNREKIKELIACGKLKIGPFYILQDEFLISGEANIRNILYGLKECEKYGKPSWVGYFPDAFGNIGQMPQILKGFNLDCVFFGRGIIPTGYANEVLGKSDEGFSEIIWQGADGSEVIGVQFVNWYNNAWEISVEEEPCLKRIREIMELSSVSAHTPYLLGMNGCDHQPVQTDLSKAIGIAKANGIDVVHTSLEDYAKKIAPYRDSFYVFKGEIAGQTGSGFGTLIGTASSRIYLKQLNYAVQRLLEKQVEPLSCMAQQLGIKYDSDIINWCWKRLMENHPHDSICGCSVDSVHKKMEVRFGDVIDTAASLLGDVKLRFAEKIATDVDKNIIVFNPDINDITEVVECFVDYREGEQIPKDIAVVDSNGDEVLSCAEFLGVVPTFILPEDRFREVFNVSRYKIKFLSVTEPTSFSKYSIADRKCKFNTSLNVSESEMENRYLKVNFHEDGSFDIYNKETKKSVTNQNYFIEVGDKGNEYEFIRQGIEHTTLGGHAKICVTHRSAVSVSVEVTSPLLQQNGLKADIKSEITLDENSKMLKIKTSFINACENHRIRAAFGCDYPENYVYADGQFDITKRKIRLGDRWKNENNPQRMSAFVMRRSECEGQIIGVRGLCEYEVSNRTNATELTLVRGVGEMGDWFYFPTSDSQCKGLVEAEYYISLFDDSGECEAIRDAYSYYANPLTSIIVKKQVGEITQPKRYIELSSDKTLVLSCMKRAEKSDKTILRLYNPSETDCNVRLSNSHCVLNMAEESLRLGEVTEVLSKQIVTLELN